MRHSTVLLTLALGVLLAAPVGAQTIARPDSRAVDAARRLVDKGARPAQVASEMAQSYRQSPAQTAAIFRSLRIRAGDGGRAIMGVYRVQGDDASSALVRGGFTAPDVVSEMTRAGVGSGDLARGLRKSGLPDRDAVRAFQSSGIGVRETVSGLRRAEVPVKETATLVPEFYGRMAPAEMGDVLRNAGYTVDPPRITRYWIKDYSADGSNRRIENYGIVDPTRVPGGGSHPLDGRVTIVGQDLDFPGTEVSIVHSSGVTTGEVRSAASGSSQDELEVEFADFRSGELRIETPGGTTTMPVVALSYMDRTVQQLFGPSPTYAFLGSRGQLTWGFIAGATTTSDFTPSESALDVAVTGTSDSPVITIGPGGGLDARVEVTFGMPTNLAGSMTPSVQCWTCGSFQIEKTECPTLTATCILNQLAEAAGSLFECADPENWREEWVDGLPIPIQGQGVFQITFATYLSLDASGRVDASAADPVYAGDVWNAIPYPPAHGPFTVAETWWASTVVPAVKEPKDDLAEAIAERLNAWPQYTPGFAPDMELIGIFPQETGGMRLAFSH